MSQQYVEKIMHAYKNGLLNKYMAKRLLSAVERGMTDSLSDELIQDAQYASDIGVENDDNYNAYFFIGRFADDILDDTFGMKVEPERKKDLCRFVMSHSGNEDYKLDNLTDYRLLVHKWLCDKLSKKAYPNIAGKENREIIYDVDKWIGTLKNIYASLHAKKLGRSAAIDYFTSDWDTDEKQKFINWMRYYESGTTEKYNVKTAKFIKEAFEPETHFPQSWVNREDRAEDSMHMSTRKEKREQTRREKELVKAKAYKSKMRSRLRAFKRLLERYNDILPKQDLDSIYDELYSLEKSISKLDVYASVQDCIIRSANRMNKFGFSEGAEFLHKVAVEPTNDIDLTEALPQPGSKEPDLLPKSTSMTNVQTVINRLEATSKDLKSRDMIRELASIDILLNEMGMASYFPEISYAQSKLIESFSYASNKVEDIVAKLRGSGKSTKPKPQEMPSAAPPPPPAPTAPTVKPIDTGELMSKPVGEVKKKLPTG
jgi:ribosomal protein S20